MKGTDEDMKSGGLNTEYEKMKPLISQIKTLVKTVWHFEYILQFRDLKMHLDNVKSTHRISWV